MKIVEIILGRKTSEETLRKAYDYVQQIGYMPIVVNDSRGFFTSRVFGTFMDEGLHLIQDGMTRRPSNVRPGRWACRWARWRCRRGVVGADAQGQF